MKSRVARAEITEVFLGSELWFSNSHANQGESPRYRNVLARRQTDPRSSANQVLRRRPIESAKTDTALCRLLQ